MHELGIAQSILEIVRQYVPQAQAAEIRKVRIRVGQLAGIVPESLEFSFQAIVADTPWNTARLDIVRVPTTASCRGCGKQFEIQDIAFLCPTCGGTDIRLISGTDLQVVEIEMEDEHAKAV